MTAAEMDIIIGAEVTGAVNGLKQVNAQLVKTEQTATKVTQKTSSNFTGLSRVIQDLPFGFIAISNNLTQLLPAAGALGLAFSAIVSAVTFASTGFRNWTGRTKESTEATNEFTKSLHAAQAGAIETGVKLQAFVNIARDSTKSLAERNYALEQANKLMGEHGEKLTLVNINTKAVTEEVNKFTQALIAQAVAAKYSDKIADLIIKQKDASLAYGAALTTYNKVAKETADINKNTFSGGTGGVGGLGNATTAVKAVSAFNSVSDAADNYKDITRELQQTTTNFNQNIAQSVSLFAQLGTKADDTTKKLKAVKEVIDDKRNRYPNFAPVTPLIDLSKLDIKPLNIKLIDTEGMRKNFDEGLKEISAMYDVIKGVVTNAAIGIGEAIGNAVSGKGNLFSSLMDVIGTSLITLGSFVIAGAELIAKITTALTAALGGTAFAGLAVGIGLIALGTIMKSIPKFGDGGIVTSPTLALIGEKGPERITPLGYEGRANNAMAGEVIFQISGQTLRGILKRADQTAYNTN